MSFASLVRTSSVLLAALILLIISAEAVSANGIPVVPSEPGPFTFFLAVSSIFLFNYLINLGSATLVLKIFGFRMNLSSVNKLAIIMFKVTIIGSIVVFLISGSLGAAIYGLSQYGISAILVGVTEIILLSFLLHSVYALMPFRKAVSVSACAIILGALIGLPFALMLI